MVKLLAAECALADAEALGAARRILDSPAGAARAARAALEPTYLRLLRALRAVDGGALLAADLRAELRALASADPAASTLEQEIFDLLAGWLHPASFELRRVTWDAPASLLETLASLEAVHAVRGWDDLKNRVDADRRIFALFHPLLGERPVAFTQIAIEHALATAIAALLDPAAPTGDSATADVAIFYSISATHRGLTGLKIGATLIERAIVALQSELPRLKTFATLSPIPGFAAWLRDVTRVDAGRLLTGAAAGDDAVRLPLLHLAARYLLERDGRRARDPVANFHLGNGARIERLNWQADPSPLGLRTSAGVMVSYLYPLRDRDVNRARYLDGGVIAASRSVARLSARAPHREALGSATF